MVTLNTHSFQEQGCVEPGGAKLCSLLRLEQIGAGLAALDADVIGLNEVMSGQFFSYDYGGESYDGAELIRLSLERASGASYNVVSFPFATWSTGERMSNVILSRAPIVESEARAITTTDFWPAPDDARSVGYARIDLAGAGFVNVFVTHAWGWDSVDTEPQIADVKTFMAEKYRGDEALDVLVGDLNMPSTAVGYSSWLQSPPFVLVDMQASAEPELPTMLGGEHRIDYVLAGTGPDWLTSPDRSFSRRVFDGGELPIVSDHFGVATTFLVDHSSPPP